MELYIKREWKKDTYTISRLYINGVQYANILEDKDRGLTSTMPLSVIKTKKVYGETAIPTGRYEISLDIVSPKYSKIAFYKDICGGKVPRLLNVPGFDGILIHAGNTAKDSYGCLLTGKNTIKGKVTSSKEWFIKVYNKLKEAHSKGEKIYITIF